MAAQERELWRVPDPSRSARIYRFPAEDRRRRLARRRMLARRRRTATVAAVSIGVATLFAGGRSASVPARAGAGEQIVVAPGETLWDIATEHGPEGVDVRAYVDELIRTNGLSGATLPAGASIELPR